MKPYATLTESILNQSQVDGDKIFCYLKPTDQAEFSAISYRQLVQRSRCYLRHYQALGIARGAPLMIILEHGEPMIYAFVGAMLGGYIPSYLAPIGERQDPAHYWAQLNEQFAHIDGGLLVTSATNQLALCSALPMNDVPVLTREQVALNGEVGILYEAQPDDIALLQHSSGTTGSRKGVALSHRAIMHQLRNYAAAIRLNDLDVIASWLPLYHDMGLISSLLLPLGAGVPVVLISPFEWVNRPGLLLDAIQQFRATLAWLPNFAFHHLARLRREQNSADLSSLRSLINCSEPCKPEAFEQFLARYAAQGVGAATLQVCYAMAEMVFAATQTSPAAAPLPLTVSRQQLQNGRLVAPVDDDVVALMPVGQTLADVTLQIVDDDGRVLDDGNVGEIVLSAPFLFSGYYRNVALTDQAMCASGYKTGDLGARYDGNIYITGRKKDLIIVNGRNYYAHDIEAVVSRVAEVKPGRCVAFGLFNPMLGSEAICVLAESESDDEAVDRKALSVRIKAAIQRDMGIIIGKAVVVPPKWLIKTTSGKMSRSANKEKYLAGLES